MYQQMTESAKALDKLHKQNEVYINGTTSTMGGMENKVIIFNNIKLSNLIIIDVFR